MSQDAEALGRSFVNFQFDSVARYTILDHLGTGGMGIVFLSQRETSGVHESVVLKTIRDLTPSTLEELRQEANLATRLRHPNIVRTYGLETVKFEELPAALQGSLADFESEDEDERGEITISTHSKRPGGLRSRRGRVGGRRRRAGRTSQPEIQFREPKRKKAEPKKPKGHDLSFIVMDYIDGIDLLELHVEHIRRGVLLPVMLGAYVIARVARALEYAHNVLIHRDVSPGNVLIDSLGMPLLSDFGIAVASGDRGAVRAGKLSYIAPEVLGGAPFDERVDLYSLGMVGYLLASGVLLQRVPKKGTLEGRLATILAQADAGFPPLHEIVEDVPEEYSQIIARMIDPDPERRPPRAGSVASEIEQKVLYAHGFGPTNNSLAAYIDIFEKEFEDYDFDQLDQLGFLKTADGQWALERELSWSLFTEKGRALCESRPDSSLTLRLRQLEAERPARTSSQRKTTKRREGRPMLKVRFGDNCMESIELTGALTIGRSAQQSQVVLVDKAASRAHAKVSPGPDGAVLEDLSSGNGTFIGSRRITSATLDNGGRFRIGKTVLYYVTEPKLARPSAARSIDAGLDGLLENPLFSIALKGRQRHLLGDLWGELASQSGLGDRATYLLNQALIEGCGLSSEEDEELVIQVLRDRTALRFLFWSAEGSDRLLKTLLLFKRILGHRAEEIEVSAEQMAVTIVRQVFDRIDFYVGDQLLLLSKSF